MLIWHWFDGHAVRFGVRAPRRTVEEISAYFAAAGDCSRRPTARLVVDVGADSLDRAAGAVAGSEPDGFAQGHPDLTYRLWSRGPGARVLVPVTGPAHLIDVVLRPDGADVHIVAASPATGARTAIRVMRQLMIRLGEHAGGVLGYAAAISQDGHVVVVAGRPGAGKTTVALNAATRFGAALCAGDRCLLMPGPAGWRAVAVPLRWRIAPGTAAALPALHQALTGGFRLRRGYGLIEGKYELTAAELAGLLDVSVQTSGPVGGIVILERVAVGNAVTPVSSHARADALASTLFRPEDALFSTDWLGLPPLRPGRLRERMRALAEAVPVHRAAWNDYPALEDLTTRVAGLLQDRP